MSACWLTMRVYRGPAYMDKIHRSMLIYYLLFNAW